jgi:hypothetical protein
MKKYKFKFDVGDSVTVYPDWPSKKLRSAILGKVVVCVKPLNDDPWYVVKVKNNSDACYDGNTVLHTSKSSPLEFCKPSLKRIEKTLKDEGRHFITYFERGHELIPSYKIKNFQIDEPGTLAITKHMEQMK